MISISTPAPAVLELDGFAWRDAGPADAETLEGLAARGSNRVLFNLPGSSEEFRARVGRPGFRIAMICTRGSRAIGAAATTERNNRSLNLQLLCFFTHAESASLALATYVRHVFWSLPMHRIYVQMPLVSGAESYVRLLKSIGFMEEGVVSGYGKIDGRTYDVTALGILRREFETWCLQNEKRLTL